MPICFPALVDYESFDYPGSNEAANRRAESIEILFVYRASHKDCLARHGVNRIKLTLEDQRSHLSTTGAERNSISLVKLTRSLVVCDHAAGRGVVMGFSSGPTSRSRRDPEPLACASKIKFFSPILGRLNLTCQRPTRFPACDGEAIACIPGSATP